MEKYNFSVDGIPVTVYPVKEAKSLSDLVASGLSKGENEVLLLPSSEADFRIELYDRSYSEPREPYIAMTALSCFFTRVRGYPNMSVNILFGGEEYTLTLDKGKGYNFLVNSGKCKTLCAKFVEFQDGISLKANILDIGGVCAALTCEDTELFDEGRIEILWQRLRSEEIKGMILASYTDRLIVKSKGNIPFYEAVRIALLILAEGGKDTPKTLTEASVNGTCHKFLRAHGALVFYPEIKYIS